MKHQRNECIFKTKQNKGKTMGTADTKSPEHKEE